MHDADRLSHTYVIGATGSGKTCLLESMIQDDAARGLGVIVLDPHGDLADRLNKRYETNANFRYIDIADPACDVGFNPVRGVKAEFVPLVVSGMIDSLRKLFDDAWGTRMEGLLRAALYAIVEAGDATLTDINRILYDKDYRTELLDRISNQQIKSYWRYEFPVINPRMRSEMALPIQTKIAAILCDPRLQSLLTRKHNVLRFRQLMDEQRLVVVNLSKGRLGVDSASLVGSLMLTAITMAALSRATVAENQRPRVMVYLDEAHLLTTSTIAEMVSELRKYSVGLVIAHQATTQMDRVVRETILGTVGSVITFRAGLDDANYFASRFGKPITAHDIVNLPARNAYAQLLVNGELTPPFSFQTLPVDRPNENNRQ